MVIATGPLESWARTIHRPRAEGAGELIPTWQEGVEQHAPNDILKFATDGYSKNSLIFSCIREKATSFAALQPVVQVPDAQGALQRMPMHRALKLLDSPNQYQDGYTFLDTLATHYEAAGNVYIQKVRRSDNAERAQAFSTFPVQELQAIRPDYVSIDPGRRKQDDVFVVRIGGSVRARIPRRDMIHIHEPNLINDFYGMSKIALLVREGAIDLEMSDFELAFFRNAGVPMGMLNIKGRTVKAEQVDEIKTRFRQAYNGVRKWFDLLVTNSDEATYTQLGTPINQMEVDPMRYHVESRICAVFGVPGIIVGARFAQNSGLSQNYEEAKHAFWSETMVPFTRQVAGAFQQSLMPEFATTYNRGALFSFDLTGVRALQEDRSRKLREVVRMINTGGFTVNQALRTNGMEAVDGGDFFVRNGNQVAVHVQEDGTLQFVQTPAGGGNQPNPDNPLVGAA